MIANLIFDLSGYGGSANFTAATEAILINELKKIEDNKEIDINKILEKLSK